MLKASSYNCNLWWLILSLEEVVAVLFEFEIESMETHGAMSRMSGVYMGNRGVDFLIHVQQ
jgi:hypothetical protein